MVAGRACSTALAGTQPVLLMTGFSLEVLPPRVQKTAQLGCGLARFLLRGCRSDCARFGFPECALSTPAKQEEKDKRLTAQLPPNLPSPTSPSWSMAALSFGWLRPNTLELPLTPLFPHTHIQSVRKPCGFHPQNLSRI